MAEEELNDEGLKDLIRLKEALVMATGNDIPSCLTCMKCLKNFDFYHKKVLVGLQKELIELWDIQCECMFGSEWNSAYDFIQFNKDFKDNIRKVFGKVRKNGRRETR